MTMLKQAVCRCLLSTLVLVGIHAPAAQIVEDVVGAYDGTLYGPTFEATGIIDGALRFDGVDDYVDLGGVDVAGSAITLATWVRFDVVPAQDSRFISKATGTNLNDHFWMIGVNGGGSPSWRFRLRVGGGAGQVFDLESSPVTIVPDQWYHVAATYDGSTKRIYVDGTQVASQSRSGSLATDATVSAALGNQPAGAGSRPHDGLLDDARIYDRALSAGEVATLAGSGSVAADLQHHWPLDAVTTPATNDYRSDQSGPWGSASTWEYFNGSSWVSAPSSPTNSDGTITIRDSHDVTVGNVLTANEIVVEAGGQMTVNAPLTLLDDSGFELQIFGTVVQTSDWVLDVSSQVQVENGGVYEHARNGGALIAAGKTTWLNGSTCVITGIVDMLPGELGQSFHHFTWNSTGQTGPLDLNAAITAINGDLMVYSTGSSTLSWTVSGNATLSISGDYIQTGGEFIYTDSGNGTFDLAGDLDISGGTLRLSNSGDSQLEVAGDFMLATGVIVTGSGSPVIVLDGATAQLFTVSGTFSLPKLVVNKSAGSVTLAAGSALEITKSVTVSNGTFDLNGQAVTLKSVGGRTATLYEDGGTVTGSTNLAVERAFAQASDGWRMLAVPLTGVSYSDLNATFHTQGAPWATVSFGTSNLQMLDVAIQDWVELDGADADFAPGTGYIFYMWENDPEGNPQLPATWTVLGSLSNVSAQSLSFNTSASDSNNLVGNPWAANLDWDATVAASTNVGTSYAVWDPSVTSGGGLSGYKYYNSSGSTGAAGPYIPPLQAFSVQATAGGSTLTFASSSAANDGDPVYYGRAVNGERARRESSPHLRLHLEGNGLSETETYLVFDSAARRGRDDFDVDRLTSLAADYATLWFEGEGGSRLAFDGRPLATGEEVFALSVAATRAGEYVLSWPDWHAIPDGWTVTLFDHETGEEVDLRAQPSYRFRLDAMDEGRSADALALPGRSANTGAARFTLRVIDPEQADTVPDPFAPDGVRLIPNFPNPFHAVTTIRYGVTERAPVHLAVYDLLGRRVATLVEEEQEPGWYSERWEAQGLAGGVYLVRLRVGAEVLTHKMVHVD